MATRSPVYCHLCNEEVAATDTLEHHLVYSHKPRELAKRLAAEWEAEELGDAV
ncbi:hypothetical protein [Natrialba sp. SSL1]|uniref:hypothetical protein n=1 Tax=Natrialba sp. SSL1 TaxID=1869245 RepID=UPI0014959BE3|nr:hypothetical protein [Natrialba sp. SSL1]